MREKEKEGEREREVDGNDVSLPSIEMAVLK
jgi:hypothetical protein